MNAKIGQIFKQLDSPQPSEGLAFLIEQRIIQEQRKSFKRKLLVSYAGLTVSAAAGLYALVALGIDFLRSEFWSLLSLLFSDALVVLGNWKSFLFSLGENFPVADAIILLIPLFSFLAFSQFLLSLGHLSSGKNLFRLRTQIL